MNFIFTIQKHTTILLVFACVASRLPQILSPHLYLDPDECVTAMMAKYLMQGKNFSLFFWGQSFGFSLIETLLITFFYSFLGIGTLAVKLAMLSLWTTGVIFLYRTLEQLTNKNNALLFTLLFVCMPGWAVWSMKARGGYISAFTLSTICTYLLYHPVLRQKTRVWLLIGSLAVLVYESQLLWLIGLLPLIGAALIEQKSLKKSLALTGAATLCFLFFYNTTSVNDSNVTHNRLGIPKTGELWRYCQQFPDYLYSSFHGHYYFSTFFPPDPASAICSALCAALIFCLVILGIKEVFISKSKNLRFIFSTFFVFGFYLLTHFMVYKEGRYFLPMLQFGSISAGIYTGNRTPGKTVKTILTGVICVGIAALNSFWYFQFEGEKEKNINELISYLKSRQIKYCFSRDCMLPWHLVFYSNETIIARIPYQNDRYQPFHTSVDSNFLAGGKTAYIGYNQYKNEYDTSKAVLINTFFVEENPDKQKIIDNFSPVKK